SLASPNPLRVTTTAPSPPSLRRGRFGTRGAWGRLRSRKLNAPIDRVEREGDREERACVRTVDGADAPTQALHRAGGEPEPQAGAPRSLGGEERFEQTRLDRDGNPDALVGDRHDQRLRLPARGYADRSALGHRIARVSQQVDEHQRELGERAAHGL